MLRRSGPAFGDGDRVAVGGETALIDGVVCWRAAVGCPIGDETGGEETLAERREAAGELMRDGAVA